MSHKIHQTLLFPLTFSSVKKGEIEDFQYSEECRNKTDYVPKLWTLRIYMIALLILATRIERANFAGLEMKEGRTGKPYNGTLPFSVSL